MSNPYTVKIISNTVSENLERLIGFYIDEVMAEHPHAQLTFQYQTMASNREDLYTCMITVKLLSIVEEHFGNLGK